MKHYLKLNSNGIIVDAVQYPADGYIEVELPDTQLPAGINGGWYRWAGVTYEEVPELKPMADVEQRIADLEAAIAAILGGVV